MSDSTPYSDDIGAVPGVDPIDPDEPNEPAEQQPPTTNRPDRRKSERGRRIGDITSPYDGWTNYPTWAVNLWLSNDEALYRERRELAAQAVADANEDDNLDIWTPEQAARYRLAETLKKWVTDDLAPDLGATFAADLLGFALAIVEWAEVADAAIEDVQ